MQESENSKTEFIDGNLKKKQRIVPIGNKYFTKTTPKGSFFEKIWSDCQSSIFSYIKFIFFASFIILRGNFIAFIIKCILFKFICFTDSLTRDEHGVTVLYY